MSQPQTAQPHRHSSSGGGGGGYQHLTPQQQQQMQYTAQLQQQQRAQQQQQQSHHGASAPGPGASSSSGAAAPAPAASSSASASAASSKLQSAAQYLSLLQYVQQALPAKAAAQPDLNLQAYAPHVSRCITLLRGATTEEAAATALNDRNLREVVNRLYSLFVADWTATRQHSRQKRALQGTANSAYPTGGQTTQPQQQPSNYPPQQAQTHQRHNSQDTQQQQQQNAQYAYAQQARAATSQPQQQQQQQPTNYSTNSYPSNSRASNNNAIPQQQQQNVSSAPVAASRSRPSTRAPSGDMGAAAAAAYGLIPSAAPAAVAAAAMAMDQRMGATQLPVPSTAHSSLPYATAARPSSSAVHSAAPPGHGSSSGGGGPTSRPSSTAAPSAPSTAAPPAQAPRSKLDVAQSHYLRLGPNGQQSFSERLAILSLMIDSPDQAPFPVPAVSLDPPHQYNAATYASSSAAAAHAAAAAGGPTASIPPGEEPGPGSARKFALLEDNVHLAGRFELKPLSSLRGAGDASVLVTQLNPPAGALSFKVTLVVPQSYPQLPCTWTTAAAQPDAQAMLTVVEAQVRRMLQHATGTKVMRVPALLDTIFTNAHTVYTTIKQTRQQQQQQQQQQSQAPTLHDQPIHAAQPVAYAQQYQQY